MSDLEAFILEFLELNEDVYEEMAVWFRIKLIEDVLNLFKPTSTQLVFGIILVRFFLTPSSIENMAGATQCLHHNHYMDCFTLKYSVIQERITDYESIEKIVIGFGQLYEVFGKHLELIANSLGELYNQNQTQAKRAQATLFEANQRKQGISLKNGDREERKKVEIDLEKSEEKEDPSLRRNRRNAEVFFEEWPTPQREKEDSFFLGHRGNEQWAETLELIQHKKVKRDKSEVETRQSSIQIVEKSAEQFK